MWKNNHKSSSLSFYHHHYHPIPFIIIIIIIIIIIVFRPPGANPVQNSLGQRKHIAVTIVIIKIIIIIIIIVIIIIVIAFPPNSGDNCVGGPLGGWSETFLLQHKLDFQIRRLPYFLKIIQKFCLFFQRLLNF